jgi:hypothetical protein
MGLSEFKVILTSKPDMIELHFFEGPARNRMMTVDLQGLSIGRDVNNTFYATIKYHAGGDGKAQGFYLQDIGSTNRTWLRLSAEGVVSALHPLHLNDILKIGSNVFVVQSNDISSLRNMPIINKRQIAAPGGN